MNLLVSKQQQAQHFYNLNHPINKASPVKVYMNVPNNNSNNNNVIDKTITIKQKQELNEPEKVIIQTII